MYMVGMSWLNAKSLLTLRNLGPEGQEDNNSEPVYHSWSVDVPA